MPNYRRYDRFAPATAALVRAPAYMRTRYTRCARNHISWTMERWTSDRKLCAWIFIRGAFPRQRDFFFFSAVPPYSGKYYFDYMGIGEPASMASASRQLCCGPMLAHSISASNKFPSRYLALIFLISFHLRATAFEMTSIQLVLRSIDF